MKFEIDIDIERIMLDIGKPAKLGESFDMYNINLSHNFFDKISKALKKIYNISISENDELMLIEIENEIDKKTFTIQDDEVWIKMFIHNEELYYIEAA